VERVLFLVILVGCCGVTAALVWPLAYAVGRVREELGPAARRCANLKCGNPANADTGYCTWCDATGYHTRRAMRRRLGLQRPVPRDNPRRGSA
jgi:hypothetical protein